MKILLIIEILIFFTNLFIRNYIKNDIEETIKASLNNSKLADIYGILNFIFIIILIIILIKAVILFF